jgi:hypothetical protein
VVWRLERPIKNAEILLHLFKTAKNVVDSLTKTFFGPKSMPL